MAKTKIIKTYCNICDDYSEIEVPADIAENRESYPFGYLDIHGNPQHALMLFLDYQLNVRDARAYHDIKIAKETDKKIQGLNRMSESEALSTIYNDPLRYKIYTNLRNGPMRDEDLFRLIERESSLSESEFNLLLIPLIRAGLIRSTYMKNTFREVYFLVEDFVVFRIPSRITAKLLKSDKQFSEFFSKYSKEVNQFLTRYKAHVTEDEDFLLREMKMGLNILSNYKYQKIYYELRKQPLTRQQLSELADGDIIDALTNSRLLEKIDTKPEPHYVIFTDMKLKRFNPKYLVDVVREKLRKKEISKESAMTQLVYLYDYKT